MRPQIVLKVTQKTTNHGSKQQKTVEDGLYLKTITQWLQKKDLKIMRDTEEILKADQQDTSIEWDWVMLKWPTSHNTRSKEKIKSKKEAIWKASAAPHSAPFMSQKLQSTSESSRKERIQNILMDWWSRTSWWIDRMKLHVERILSEKQIRMGTTRTRPRRNRKIRATDPDSREWEIA